MGLPGRPALFLGGLLFSEEKQRKGGSRGVGRIGRVEIAVRMYFFFKKDK